MIKAKQIQLKTDKPVINYRKLDALNQTMLKVFDEDPIRFYEEFKLGKPRKEKKGTSLQIGDLVDFYLLECKGDDDTFQERFNERFALFSGTKGSGQVFLLADYLFDETIACINDKGEVTCSFETRFDEAVRKVRAEDKYKGKSDKAILEDFNEKGKLYFDTLIDNMGKTVVDMSVVDKARTVAINLFNDPFTKDLMRQAVGIGQECFTHFPIAFKYDLGEGKTIDCKAELDMMYIYHKTKVIAPIDLKTTYDNESFDINYIKNGYYIQNSFYNEAVKKWAAECDMEDYVVKPMEFVVGDTSANNRRPLTYVTNWVDLAAGMNGFDYRGQYHRGVKELIEDIAWAEQNDEWRCSRHAFKNDGKIMLRINYEGEIKKYNS